MAGTIGRPGGSAEAEYRRRRTAQLAGWIGTVPWRLAAVLGGVAAGLLAAMAGFHLAVVVGALVAAGAGWMLRFRPSPNTRAWQRGALGERRTAQLLAGLERQGWTVLHDLAIPGSAANIDHLLIGPGGVVVVDSKQYRGRLQLDPYGNLWHGRHPLASTEPPLLQGQVATPVPRLRSGPVAPPGQLWCGAVGGRTVGG